MNYLNKLEINYSCAFHIYLSTRETRQNTKKEIDS